MGKEYLIFILLFLRNKSFQIGKKNYNQDFLDSNRPT